MNTIIGFIVVGILFYYLMKSAGMFRTEEDKYQDMIGKKSRELATHRNSSFLYVKRGEIYIQLGLYYSRIGDDKNTENCINDALKDFHKALELNSGCGEAYYHIGIIEWLKRDDIAAFYSMSTAEQLGYKKATEFKLNNNMR